MRISADILVYELEKKYSFKVIGSLSSELILERPLFWSHAEEIKDNQIYMGQGGQPGSGVPGNRAASILLYAGPMKKEFIDLFEAVLLFDERADVFSLYNCVQEIYSEHEAWDHTLQELLNSGMGAQAMLDSSERIFQNPLQLHNSNLVTLACSSTMPDWLLDEDLLSEFTSNLKMSAEFIQSFEKKRATIFPEHLTGMRSMYVNIFDQGIFQYRLLVNETARKFLPSDGVLLEHLAHYIKLALNADTYVDYSEFKTLPNVLKGIISGSITDLRYAGEQLSRNGWQMKHHYFCISVLLDILDVQNHTAHNLVARINKLVRGACAFMCNDGIRVYVNLDIFKGDSEDVISRLAPFFRDNNLKAGVSSTFTGFEEIKLHFIQAELALSVGLRHRPTFWIHRYKDNVEDLLLECCISKLPARMLCAQELLRLREYDEANSTKYYLTLLTYLQNHMNKVQTAKDLYINRSTFLYRLNRIRTLTGLDLETNYNQWYLLLSFELLAM
jgi:hypothetical protein